MKEKSQREGLKLVFAYYGEGPIVFQQGCNNSPEWMKLHFQ
jgi:hypothetical protein